MGAGGASFAYGPELIPSEPDGAVGLWHWRRLLSVDGSDSYPLAVGGTPLIRSPTLSRTRS